MCSVSRIIGKTDRVIIIKSSLMSDEASRIWQTYIVPFFLCGFLYVVGREYFVLAEIAYSPAHF